MPSDDIGKKHVGCATCGNKPTKFYDNSMILVNHGWKVKLTTSLLLGAGGIEIVTILALALFATLGLFPERLVEQPVMHL